MRKANYPAVVLNGIWFLLQVHSVIPNVRQHLISTKKHEIDGDSLLNISYDKYIHKTVM